MKTTMKNKQWKIVVVNILLTLILLAFFINICPIVPYDTDDWIFLGQMRIPFPIWKGWEPTRVLPEVLMPICGYISAYLVYPLVGDYFFAITITAAVFLTTFIMLLCLCVMQFMRRRFQTSVELSLIYEVLFLIFNFLIFRNRGTSRYMFCAADMTCIFYYTISGIVNAVAILTMMQYEDFQAAYKSFSTLKKGLFVSLIYFALLSNIFHSETIAIYCGVALLGGFVKLIRNKTMKFKDYIQKYQIYLVILFAWMIVILFEICGGRASSVSSGVKLDFEKSIRQLYAMVQALADPFVLLAVISLGWLVYRIIRDWWKHHKLDEKSNIYVNMLFNLMLVTIYLIVLCSGVNYMSRIEASWNIWFYVILLTLLGIADFVSSHSVVKPMLVLTLVICTALALYPNGRFTMSTVDNVDYVTCVSVGKYITNQIIEADHKGEDSVIVHVSVYEDEDRKWVFGDNFGQLVATTLYNHGIIQHKIKVQADNDTEPIDDLWIKTNLH